MATLGNITSIGPITVTFRNPEGLRWQSSPQLGGDRPCTLAGSALTAQAHALAELVANPTGRVTRSAGGSRYTGQLKYVTTTGDALTPLGGLYLLVNCILEVERLFTFGDRLLFQLDALFLGDVS